MRSAPPVSPSDPIPGERRPPRTSRTLRGLSSTASYRSSRCASVAIRRYLFLGRRERCRNSVLKSAFPRSKCRSHGFMGQRMRVAEVSETGAISLRLSGRSLSEHFWHRSVRHGSRKQPVPGRQSPSKVTTAAPSNNFVVRPDDVPAAALSALEKRSVRATEALKREVEPQFLLPSAYGM